MTTLVCLRQPLFYLFTISTYTGVQVSPGGGAAAAAHAEAGLAAHGAARLRAAADHSREASRLIGGSAAPRLHRRAGFRGWLSCLCPQRALGRAKSSHESCQHTCLHAYLSRNTHTYSENSKALCHGLTCSLQNFMCRVLTPGISEGDLTWEES